MADSFVRVELHERWSGDKPDYELLHRSMEQEGFARYMYEGAKKVQLPTGMYRSTLNASILAVKAKAIFAANKTGYANEGVISRGEEHASWNLKQLPFFLASTLRRPNPVSVPNTDWAKILYKGK